jgi:hypothetical protein
MMPRPTVSLVWNTRTRIELCGEPKSVVCSAAV